VMKGRITQRVGLGILAFGLGLTGVLIGLSLVSTHPAAPTHAYLIPNAPRAQSDVHLHMVPLTPRRDGQ
jgi:hypothetical protein